MVKKNWQNHGDDFKRGIGKLSNKQTNTRMSFYEREQDFFNPKGEPWDDVIPDFDIPDLKDESHPPECKPCDPNISGDPYEESLPTESGEKTGRLKNYAYSSFATEKYSSQFMRFQRSLDLRLRGFDSEIDENGDIQYKFCSKRSPSNYWTVRKSAGTRSYVSLQCWEESGGVYRGKVLKFISAFQETQIIQVVNAISPAPVAGIIEVWKWAGAANIALTGRLWHTSLLLSGGTFEFMPSEFGSNSLSFFARNPATGYYDGLFFEVVEGAKTIKLVGF